MISIVIGVDIVFALTRICDEFCHLHLQFLDQFLLFSTHGESELLCDYNEIMHRYCHCIVAQRGGWVTSIQGIKGGSLLLLLMLAVKKREARCRPGLSFLRRMKTGLKEKNQGTMESREV
jgi:hypothetical protein